MIQKLNDKLTVRSRHWSHLSSSGGEDWWMIWNRWVIMQIMQNKRRLVQSSSSSFCFWWSLIWRYSPLSWADSLCLHVILHEWLAFNSAFFWIATKVVYLSAGMAGATWNCYRLSTSCLICVTFSLCVCVCVCVRWGVGDVDFRLNHLLYSVQFSSRMVSMRSEWPISAAPCLSEVSPTLPLKQFQCLSDWQLPSLILSRKILFPCLSLSAYRPPSFSSNW